MPDKFIVIRFFKPYDVLTKFTDEEGRPTLADYIDVPDVYAAGRLDKDSEGLLILTNHNPLKTRLTEPKYAHPRTYLVQVERIPDEVALEKLRKGVELQGYKTRPAKVKLLENEPSLPPRNPPIRERKSIPTTWLEITLTEGKNRQVRRMTAAVGHPTLRLVRTKIGEMSLAGLDLGQWAYLTDDEQKSLFKSLSL